MIILFMFGMLFFILKIVGIAVKMAWGITKIILNVFVFPIILIFLVFEGFLYISFPLLVIALIAAILFSKKEGA